ncbi:MAG: PepSY domain-containing protein [Gemmatimonadetes bacterium]|nr:PepSY domain-containing protein [Gemmatimonadota bacterium]MCY3942974.1 PepSY domain-containing protein [Gemmatimonadota bacterium]
MFRRLLLRAHRSVALAAGVFIAAMAASGAVLACEEAVLSIWGSRTQVEEGEGGGIVAASDRREIVGSHLESEVALGPSALERFFERVREVHRWLAFPGGGERTGRRLTGAANLGLLFLLLTGALLWVPWPLSRRALAANFAFPTSRGRLRGRARRLRLHRAIGVWALLPLAVISATGAILSFPSLGDWSYPIFGAAIPGGEESAPEVVLQVHTGELWGLVGRAVAGVAALAALAMIWTGATSALRRRR